MSEDTSPQTGLSPATEAAIADLEATLPDQVPRDEVLRLVRFHALIEGIGYAADAQRDAERITATLEDARRMIRDALMLYACTEDELQTVHQVLKKFSADEYPQLAELHRELATEIHTRH